MKKIVSLLLCFALICSLCLALCSCNEPAPTEEPPAPDPNAANYDSAVALLNSGDYAGAKALFESLGDYKDSKEHLSRFYYMPSRYTFDLIGKQGESVLTFNDKNLPLRDTVSINGSQNYSEFEYNANGDILKQSAVKEGNLYTYDFTYNDKGLMATAVYLAYDGNTATHLYTYTDEGLIESEIYSVNGVVDYDYTNTYDENGNLICREYTTGGVRYVLNVTYTYDANGRTIKEEGIYDNGIKEIYEYEYDDAGNVLKRTFTDGEDYVTYNEYTYDSHGNSIKEVYTDENGVKQTIEMEYVLVYIPTGITNGTEFFFYTYWANNI